MSEYTIESFNTEPLLLEIENVIKSGLNTILKDFKCRYELLEKTHNKIMNLPSVKNELNQCVNSDSDEEESIVKNDDNIISDVKKFTSELVRDQICGLEGKLGQLEKKYDAVLPILDKILNKLHVLNDDVKILKQQPIENKCVETPSPVIKASIVSACENENIKFEIKEKVDEEKDVCEEEESVAGLEEESVASLEADDVETVEEDVEETLEEDVEESLEVETEASDDESVEEVEETVAGLEEVEESVEDEEEVEEIEIDDVTYFTNDEENGFIYEATADEEVGDKVGYFKDGEPFFYADEK